MGAMTSLANDSACHQTINTTFADSNRGFQAGTITGHVNAQFHHYAPERPETPPSPASTILPFDRDPDYVQRSSLLEEIGAKLSRPAARVALVGLGGVGKSQLAIEYAHQLRLQSPETWILWMYASNAVRFEQSVRNVLDQLKVRGRKDPKANVFQLLQGWLSDATKGPWLVILDSADDAHVVLERPSASEQAGKAAVSALSTQARIDYLPRCDHGKILVTSRSEDAAKELVYQKDVVAVGPMEEGQALALLQMKLEVWYDDQHAPRLARELDFMPLALAQAAAYMFQRNGRCSIEQYLVKLQQCDKSDASVLDLNERDLRRDREASNSIMLTWQISFNHIRETHPSAAELLSLMSFFDRQAIPEALLHERGDSQAKSGIDQGEVARTDYNIAVDKSREDGKTGVWSDANEVPPADNAELLEMDVRTLRSYSFISLIPSTTAFDMHRLVQLATQRWLKAARQLERWRDQSICNLAAAFPDTEYRNWRICRSLFPHAFLSMKNKPEDANMLRTWGVTLEKAGLYILQQGQVKEAEELFVTVKTTWSAVFGDEHIATLACSDNIAVIYWMQGQWQKAEELELYVINLKSKMFHRWQPEILSNIARLSANWEEQGRLKEMENLEEEVLKDLVSSLGAHHRSTLVRKAELASTYEKHGSWDTSTKLRQEIVDTCLDVYGREDRITLDSLASLASTFKVRKMWGEYQRQEKEILDIKQGMYGADHASTLVSMASLALAYKKQGKWGDAGTLEKEVIAERRRTLGEADAATMSAMAELARTHHHQAQWGEAKKILVSLVEIREKVLGDEHPDTLCSKEELADVYGYLGRLKESEELHTRVMETRMKVLDEDHPDTLQSISRLMGAYQTQGRTAKLKVLQDRFGSTHLLASQNRLRWPHECAGRGVDHPDASPASFFKAQREVSDIEDTLAEEEQEEEEDREAPVRIDASPGDATGDTTQGSSIWTQPQFLWLL